MRLTLEGIKDRTDWEQVDITLPGYNVEQAIANAKKAPMWAHFGIGNIFRIFLGGIAVILHGDGQVNRKVLGSMDNVSHNGDLLRTAVLTMANAWLEKGYVTEDFIAYMEKYGDATKLQAIPVAIAGWLRYLLAVDDQETTAYELAPDPLVPEMQRLMQGIVWNDPATLKDQLKPILSNRNIFYVDLYEAGIGELIEDVFREELKGVGSVRKTIQAYLDR